MDRAKGIAAQFDGISEVYDETREPLGEAAMDKVRDLLVRDGCASVIEVGVGTGRIAKPLQERRFDLVGLDLSAGMLRKAQGKGVQGLVLADANHLPTRQKSFDAAMMAHVLHLLESPAVVFSALEEVARKDVVVLVRRRNPKSGGGDGYVTIREVLKRLSEETGEPILDRREARHAKEVDFLSNFPPDELATVQEVNIDTTVGERLAFLEKRPFSWSRDIPEEAFRRAIKELRSTADLGTRIRFKRVEQAAVWRLPRRAQPSDPFRKTVP